MNRFRMSLLGLLVLGFLCPSLSFAQTEEDAQPARQLWLIYEQDVAPAKAPAFEASLKKLTEAMQQHVPDFRISVSMREDFHYYMAIPIDNWAEFDSPSPVAALAKELGQEAAMELMQNIMTNVRSSTTFFLTQEPSLSHMNMAPPEGNMRLHFTYFYAKPENEGKMWEVAQAWKKLDQEKASPVNYVVYSGNFGTEDVLLVHMKVGNSTTEIAENDAKTNQLRGKEGGELWQKTSQVLDRVEHYDATYRADLSLTGSTTETAKK